MSSYPDYAENFPFEVMLKDGTVIHTNLLSFTHRNMVTVNTVAAGYGQISLDDIESIDALN